MNKPSKCKNCQWYGKPYWSIINPCDNCPNENNVEIITIGDTKPIQEILTEKEIKKLNEQLFDASLLIAQKDDEIRELNNIINELKQKLNLAENILYDYLYKDKKITKELYDSFKGLKGDSSNERESNSHTKK